MPPSNEGSRRRAPRPHLTTVVGGAVSPGKSHAPVAQLADVQFWVMGRDVEHPDGNLLTRLGFLREPAPDPRWPSRYRRADTDVEVVIWPCGILFDRPGRSRLLVRGLAPVVVAEESPAALFDPSEVFAVRDRGTPCAPSELLSAADWFAQYEASVEDAVGVGHRRPRPGSRPNLAPRRPCSLEVAWRELARRLRRFEDDDPLT